MTTKSLYIDIHVIQTVPPSNLNRDDAGSPKQALYGGVRRARVSSQAWKRATRKHFETSAPEAPRATRTARVASLLTRRLGEVSGLDHDQAERVSEALLKPLKIAPGKKNEDKTAYLLFFGRQQIERLTDHAVAHLPSDVASLTNGELEDLLSEVSAQDDFMAGHPLDVALFGRMVADLPALNVDASVQVAHAVSTHAVETEFDYFTAVDDEKDRAAGEDAGAAMIGTTEFNSATLYRYATVAFHQLVENLGGAYEDALEGVERFLDGFVRSMPTGHQNSFAHRTLPDAVVVIARDDQPVNLVAAFEDSIRAHAGYAGASLRALAHELELVGKHWGGHPVMVASTYRLEDEKLVSLLGPSVPFDDVVAATSSAIRNHFAASAQ